MTITTETVQVESFEVIERELGEQAPEMEAETIALVEKLDLEGQRTFTKERTDDGETVRVPFRMGTDEELRVYGQLLPTKAAVEDYAAGPIPLRILHIVEKARETDFFDKGLFVWYKSDALAKDPVLIGIRSIPGQTWGEHTFILGRWGEVLLSFEELLEQAIASWKTEVRVMATAKTKDLAHFIDVIDAQAQKHFSGQHVYIP